MHYAYRKKADFYDNACFITSIPNNESKYGGQSDCGCANEAHSSLLKSARQSYSMHLFQLILLFNNSGFFPDICFTERLLL